MPVTDCFIFGDANESAETAKTTLDWLQKNLKCGIANKMIEVFPGTRLYQITLEKGGISDPVDFLRQGCPLVYVPKIIEKELGDLVTQITLLPYQIAVKLNNVELLNDDDPFDMHTTGNFDNCGEKIANHQYLPFSLERNNWPHCQGRHVSSFPISLIVSILPNITTLTKSGKVALRGMVDCALEFTTKIQEQCDNPVLIDLSEEKQLMHISGQKVEVPGIIKEQYIANLVTLVPDFLNAINHIVEQYYKFDKVSFFSIYDLFEPQNHKFQH